MTMISRYLGKDECNKVLNTIYVASFRVSGEWIIGESVLR